MMSDLADEPTIPVGPIPSGLGVDEELGSADPAMRQAPGVHRRDDDGADGDRRWPWLAALVVLTVFGALGLTWLVSSIPRPSSFGGPSATPPPSVRLSTPGGAVSGEPPSTPTAAISSAPAATTPTPAPSTTPTVSPTPSTTAESKPPPGPTLIAVPDVVGRREPSATATLRNAGFSVTVVHVTAESRRGINRVVAQSPAGGQQALKGSTVTIQVGGSTD